MSNDSFRIESPWPGAASTLILPSPVIGNNRGLRSQVRIIRMMDGSKRSFVKRGGDKYTHRWEFTLSRDKMEEVSDYIKHYRAATHRVTWRSKQFIGKLILNPAEFAAIGRAGGWPGDEAYNLTLELVEV